MVYFYKNKRGREYNSVKLHQYFFIRSDLSLHHILPPILNKKNITFITTAYYNLWHVTRRLVDVKPNCLSTTLKQRYNHNKVCLFIKYFLFSLFFFIIYELNHDEIYIWLMKDIIVFKSHSGSAVNCKRNGYFGLDYQSGK